MAYIEFKDVIKAYGEGDARIHALDGASFTVERGELAIILGASGAGKTTALNILGGMDTVTSGSVTVDGRDVSSANEAQLVEYRRADSRRSSQPALRPHITLTPSAVITTIDKKRLRLPRIVR